MRARVTAALVLAAAAAGCDAAGQPGGNKAFTAQDVPFRFELPAEFTEAEADPEDTRGDVVAAAGITKLDAVAVRRVAGRELPREPVRHEVRGEPVTSLLYRVPEHPGFAFECQFTEDYAERVREACRIALRTVARR